MAKASELTDLQRKFIDLLFSDDCRGNYRTAKSILKKAGYKSTDVDRLVETTKEHIVEHATYQLAMSAPAAVFGLEDGLANPTDIGAKERLGYIKEILDRVGLVKREQVDLNTQAPVGIFILPQKAVDEVPDESQEE